MHWLKCNLWNSYGATSIYQLSHADIGRRFLTARVSTPEILAAAPQRLKRCQIDSRWVPRLRGKPKCLRPPQAATTASLLLGTDSTSRCSSTTKRFGSSSSALIYSGFSFNLPPLWWFPNPHFPTKIKTWDSDASKHIWCCLSGPRPETAAQYKHPATRRIWYSNSLFFYQFTFVSFWDTVIHKTKRKCFEDSPNKRMQHKSFGRLGTHLCTLQQLRSLNTRTRDLTMNQTSAEHWTGTATVNSCQPLSRQSAAIGLQITGWDIINSRGEKQWL